LHENQFPITIGHCSRDIFDSRCIKKTDSPDAYHHAYYKSNKGVTMGSNAQQTRQRQKENFEKKLAARKAELTKRGVDAKRQQNDKVILFLQAQIKRSAKALASIAALEKVITGVKVQKQERAAQKAAEGPKAKKKKEEAAAPAKEKKEKKAKKAEKGDKPEKAPKAPPAEA
jgi:hypothetical protein